MLAWLFYIIHISLLNLKVNIVARFTCRYKNVFLIGSFFNILSVGLTNSNILIKVSAQIFYY